MSRPRMSKTHLGLDFGDRLGLQAGCCTASRRSHREQDISPSSLGACTTFSKRKKEDRTHWGCGTPSFFENKPLRLPVSLGITEKPVKEGR